MWMIESESADFHSWLKKTAASNKTGVTFMLSRDISPPSTPDKPRVPGREPTDLNPEKRSRCFSPSAGRSGKFPSVFAWRSYVGVTLVKKSSRGSDSDWHPVEIPTLNHILETPHPKRYCVQGSWGAGWTGRSFTESIFNHSMTWGQTLLSWKVGPALMTRDSEPLRPCDAVFPAAPITEPTAAAASADPANGQNFHLHQVFFSPLHLNPFWLLPAPEHARWTARLFWFADAKWGKRLTHGITVEWFLIP